MKILSSFDTNFKQEIIEKEKERYNDKVYVISHGKFYYYFYIIIPTITLIIFSIIYFIILYFIADGIDGDGR
jgi:uncharacterized membrane protein YukC